MRTRDLADVRIRWMRRLRGGPPEGAQNLSSPRFNAFIKQGDLFDESGLYLRALNQYMLAIQQEPFSSRGYRKAALTMLKSGDLQQAREYLNMAALYAKNSVERLRFLQTKYLLLATEMELDPCLGKLKEQFQVLDLGLQERANDIILLGGYVVASTFALWKLKGLPESVLLDIHRIGLHYHALFVRASVISSPYNDKYILRLREEFKKNIDHLPPTFQEIWKLHITLAS